MKDNANTESQEELEPFEDIYYQVLKCSEYRNGKNAFKNWANREFTITRKSTRPDERDELIKELSDKNFTISKLQSIIEATEVRATLWEKQYYDLRNIGTRPDEREWISVKDRYPKDYERVLLYDSRDKYPNSVSVGYLVASQTRPDYITHWMPLPEDLKSKDRVN